MLWISLKYTVVVSQTIIVSILTIFKVLQLKPQNIHCVEYSCELFDPPGNDIYGFKILKLLLIINYLYLFNECVCGRRMLSSAESTVVLSVWLSMSTDDDGRVHKQSCQNLNHKHCIWFKCRSNAYAVLPYIALVHFVLQNVVSVYFFKLK